MSTLYTKKTKIENGKWGYRGFVVEKSDKLWDVTEGEISIREQLEPDKTIKAVCLQIDALLGYTVTKFDNEKTSERKKPVIKSNSVKKDIEKILLNNFAKTRKSKYVYNEDGKPIELSFEIVALDSVYKYEKPIMLNFDSDIVKAKRIELVSMSENTDSEDIIDRINESKLILSEVNQEKHELATKFKGYDLVKERSKLDEKHWFPITFSIDYVDNSNFTPEPVKDFNKNKDVINDDNIHY